MPYIEVKTSRVLSAEKKRELSQKLIAAFGEVSSKEVAANIQMAVVDGCWMNFRGDVESPTAHILVCPGPLTPSEDYRRIIDAFFSILVEELETQKDHIYINILEFQNWGYDGEMVDVPKRHDNTNQ